MTKPNQTEELTENCCKCGKAITDSEWVVNWTSCSDCFDEGFQAYLDSPEGKAWEKAYGDK